MSTSPSVTVLQGDCLERMAEMEPASVDLICTDPPYGLEFMGKEWDKLAVPKPGHLGGFADGTKPSFARVKRHLPAMQEWHYAWALAALRVAKPGAHLFAFGGTRTHHRLACAIEDAGWEIRDCLMWVYGSGFPKSLDVSKALDKAAGAEREVVGYDATRARPNRTGCVLGDEPYDRSDNGATLTAPATEVARQWDGWGTALKPAWEPIILARKPLEGTVAQNVQKWGTGALNIDGCRVSCEDHPGVHKSMSNDLHEGWRRPWRDGSAPQYKATPKGRWPANLLHDGSQMVLDLFPHSTSGANPTRRSSPKFQNAYGEFVGQEKCEPARGAESGSAARFFYCCKASRHEREAGLEDLEPRPVGMSNGAQAHGEGYDKGQDIGLNRVTSVRNHHPTVKPIALMRYLVRLGSGPVSGLVLDPFMGSGSTGIAALLEGQRFVGIEKEAEYVEIARRRIGAVGLEAEEAA